MSNILLAHLAHNMTRTAPTHLANTVTRTAPSQSFTALHLKPMSIAMAGLASGNYCCKCLLGHRYFVFDSRRSCLRLVSYLFHSFIPLLSSRSTLSGTYFALIWDLFSITDALWCRQLCTRVNNGKAVFMNPACCMPGIHAR